MSRIRYILARIIGAYAHPLWLALPDEWAFSRLGEMLLPYAGLHEAGYGGPGQPGGTTHRREMGR